MIYSGNVGDDMNLIEKIWFWFSQFLDDHPTNWFSCWPCRCQTCCSYAEDDGDF
jgi:hypothetical protein